MAWPRRKFTDCHALNASMGGHSVAIYWFTLSVRGRFN